MPPAGRNPYIPHPWKGVGNAINLSSYCPSLERVKGEEIKNILKLMALGGVHI